jgi:3-hydroxybutyryl-CoA dehydrogenase
MNIIFKKIGIIGAGQMGTGIAHACAISGYKVIIQDINSEQLENARNNLIKNFDKAVQKQIITLEHKKKAFDAIEFINNIQKLSDCDLVIEAASEKEAVKKEIFQKLSQILPINTYIVSNTSSISITRLASYTNRPERFMGVHFMNPVPLMKLVELIKGFATHDQTIQDMQAFIKSLGKEYSQSQDYPGFIVNRILIPMINEAIYAVYEGVGSIETIDNSMKLGANQPIGPLQLADLIGLDTCLSIMQVLYDGFSDSKYRPCPLLIKYVEAGWLGRKTQKGFYNYN